MILFPQILFRFKWLDKTETIHFVTYFPDADLCLPFDVTEASLL